MEKATYPPKIGHINPIAIPPNSLIAEASSPSALIPRMRKLMQYKFHQRQQMESYTRPCHQVTIDTAFATLASDLSSVTVE